MYKEELKPFPLKLFQETVEDGIPPNSDHSPDSKTRQRHYKKGKLHANITNLDKKVFNKILPNQIQ